MDGHVNAAELGWDRFFIHALEAQVTFVSTLAKVTLMMFLFSGYDFSACWGWDMFSGFHW
jgi:hypothetical protein